MKSIQEHWTVSKHDDNNDIVIRDEQNHILANCTVDNCGDYTRKELEVIAGKMAITPKLLELALQYKSDVETRINELETERSIAVVDYDDDTTQDDLDDIEDCFSDQIAHWQATLAQINEVLAEN